MQVGEVLESLVQSQPLTYRYGVKLERGQRGTYGWEITVRGEDRLEVLADIGGIDRSLVAVYATPKES